MPEDDGSADLALAAVGVGAPVDGLEGGESLGRQVSRGFRWSLTGQVVSRLGVFATGIVLARVAAPQDFGIYAVALAAFNLLMMINEVGMVAAIVRAPDAELTEAVRTGQTLAFCMSLFLAVLTFVAAPWFASASGASDATAILRLFVVAVLIDGAMTGPLALLGRSFQQNKMVAADIVGLVVYMVLASSLAWAGAGAWSIAVGRVGGSAAAAVLLLIFSPHLPFPGFDRVQARKLLKFGVPLTTAALVAEAVMNADYLVVGKTLGAVTLGIYLLAFNLSTWPVSAVMVAIGRVAFPAFARLADDRARMKRAYVRSLGLILTGIFPIVVLLAFLSTNVIQFLYGGRWLPASTPLRFLLVLAIGRVAIQTTLEFLAAGGAAGTILKVQIAWLVVLVPALIVGAERYGLAGVGVAHMTVVLLWVLPLLGLTLHRRNVELRPVARVFIRPLIGAVAVLLAAAAVEHFVGGSFLELVAAGSAGMAVYLAVVLPHNELVEWGWRQARGIPEPTALASA